MGFAPIQRFYPGRSVEFAEGLEEVDRGTGEVGRLLGEIDLDLGRRLDGPLFFPVADNIGKVRIIDSHREGSILADDQRRHRFGRTHLGDDDPRNVRMDEWAALAQVVGRTSRRRREQYPVGVSAGIERAVDADFDCAALSVAALGTLNNDLVERRRKRPVLAASLDPGDRSRADGPDSTGVLDFLSNCPDGVTGRDGVQKTHLAEIHTKNRGRADPTGGKEKRPVAPDAHDEIGLTHRRRFDARKREGACGCAVDPNRYVLLPEGFPEFVGQIRRAGVVLLGDDTDIHSEGVPPSPKNTSPDRVNYQDTYVCVMSEDDWFERALDEGEEDLFEEDFASAFEAAGVSENPETNYESPPDSELPRLDLGIEGLDAMIQGGIPTRSLLAVIGSAGTGKTTVGLQFLSAGLAAGERAIFVTLEQDRETILATAGEFGWPFESYADSGALAVVDLDPVELAHSLDTIRSELPRLIDEHGTARLVLDSVSLLEMMYDDPARRRNELYDFARSLKSAGVTALLTSEASETNAYASRYGTIEYLTDGVLVLQYIRTAEYQATRLGVEIQKLRNTNHSRELKPYEIDESGISVYQQANIF